MEELDRLYESIITTQDIICANCKSSSTLYNIGEFEAAEKFQSMGWRVTKYNNVYCPNCAKVKLK